jgi:hypothetical protein
MTFIELVPILKLLGFIQFHRSVSLYTILVIFVSFSAFTHSVPTFPVSFSPLFHPLHCDMWQVVASDLQTFYFGTDL